MTAPESRIQLPASDVAKLIKLLQFIDDWLGTGNSQVSESFAQFIGHPAYGISHLRGDLQRLAFLLGADNENQLFGE